MNILLVNKYFYPKGGAENSFFQTAKLLENEDHKISFFSMNHARNFNSKYTKYFVNNIDYDNTKPLQFVEISNKLIYSFEAKKNFEQLIIEEKPDIVHLNNIYHQISPSILHVTKKYNIPSVMSLRDYKMVCASYLLLKGNKICHACANGKYYNCLLTGCVKNSYIKSLLNTIEMYIHHNILHIYDLVDQFISPSEFLKRKLGEMGFKSRIEYLPNFVLLDSFFPEYKWSENSIIYFGRLSKEKGLFTLMEAMKGNNTTLKILGEGPLRTELENKMKEDKINNIEFLGHMEGEELKNEVKKSMFTILPSEWYENNPRAIIESFALGKPAIGARIGGIPELIKDNETGLTFESGNSHDLYKKIKYMMEIPEKIIEMGKNARSLIERKFDSKSHYVKLISIYKSLLE